MEQTNTNTQQTGEKTFTQEQVNAIIGERLAKEKGKGEAALAERERQIAEREATLANREAMIDLKDRLKDMGLPAELLPVLNVKDKAALDKALDALKSYVADQVTNNKKSLRVLEPNKLPEGNHNTEDSPARKLRKAMHLPD